MRNSYSPLFAMAVALPLLSAASPNKPKSGLPLGQEVSAFRPTHVTGPDAGTNTCPVCKYGNTPAVQVWVTGDNLDNVGKIARTLESSIQKVGPNKLKGFVIFVKPKDVGIKTISIELKQLATTNGLSNVGLLYVDGPTDTPVRAYRINTAGDIKNTILVYHQRHVDANYFNFTPDKANLDSLRQSVMKACAH